MATTPSNTQSDNLVNEKPLPTTLEDALSQLKDSRDEVTRMISSQQSLKDQMIKQQADLSRFTQRLEANSPARSRTAPILTKNENTSAPGLSAPVIEADKYTGPSQKEIFLAIVGGAFREPLKMNDQVVHDTAQSSLGMAEIVYAYAVRRATFGP